MEETVINKDMQNILQISIGDGSRFKNLGNGKWAGTSIFNLSEILGTSWAIWKFPQCGNLLERKRPKSIEIWECGIADRI